ncbi:MAG: adenylyltransferase/cytidyltransferase family protein [Elusimicrobiota bacterium]
MNRAEKIQTLRGLIRLRQAWSFEGKTVVFTNGVFDILHAGHVRLLEKARGMGDALIVGLNSDESVRRLGKGPDRPINAWTDRADVLSALSCVDAVIRFDDDTPENLARELRPDILAKGADYRGKSVAGAKFAGKVVLIALKKGYSTTAIINRLRRI